MPQPLISIIIVNYKARVELEKCLTSIVTFEAKTNIEVLILNNDTTNTLKELHIPTKLDAKVINLKNNLGFGAACNVGVSKATGTYLFFLNPDTQLKNNAISQSIAFLKIHQQYGAVAPLLLDVDGNMYPEQGSKRYSWLSFIIQESFLSRLAILTIFNNDHFLTSHNNDNPKQVSVVPGTAFAITKDLFTSMYGFDERFFLYYEDLDICHRIEDAGYELAIIHNGKIQHEWGSSAKKESQATKYFLESRKKYAEKYFGLIPGLIAYYLVTLPWIMWPVTIIAVFAILKYAL